MPITLPDLNALASLPFDDIIDVRSPSEYAEDHIPGAISLPVMSDDERAKVGTIYTRTDKFLAKKIGAAIVARNAAAHLEGPLADKPGGWRPLVYCWRGGQRSGSFSTILAQIGWRTDTIVGGYKSYRRLVVDAVREGDIPHRIVLIDGNTGTAKTDILALLADAGHQVIDLEGLGAHRGSVFGHRAGGQPSQAAFESALAMRLAAMDPARPVIMEAESNKIGQRHIPPAVWTAMRAAPRVEISAPVEARAAYLVRAYSDIIADRVRLDASIEKLRPIRGGAAADRWRTLADAGDYVELAADLMREHYDPSYQKSRQRGGAVRATVPIRTLEPGDLANARPDIERAIAAALGNT